MPLRRYVYGPGTDEPIVWYEGSGTTDRRWLHADERGSVIAVSDGTGAALAINKYDPYGKPASGNLGRFGYTGQAWLPELGMWYYKARIYNPENNVARFMQSDPIGYGGGMNMYAYVGGDPVNATDPMGLCRDNRGYCLPAGVGTNISGHTSPSAAGVFPGSVSTSTSFNFSKSDYYYVLTKTEYFDANGKNIHTGYSSKAYVDDGFGSGAGIGVLGATQGNGSSLENENGTEIVVTAKIDSPEAQETYPKATPIPGIGNMIYPRNEQCTKFGHTCLQKNPFTEKYRKECSEAEYLCNKASYLYKWNANSNIDVGREFCIGRVCVHVSNTGRVSNPFPKTF